MTTTAPLSKPLHLEPRPAIAMALLALVVLVVLALMLLAMARPIDHDESQYVAAAVLAWGKLPYREFAYLRRLRHWQAHSPIPPFA